MVFPGSPVGASSAPAEAVKPGPVHPMGMRLPGRSSGDASPIEGTPPTTDTDVVETTSAGAGVPGTNSRGRKVGLGLLVALASLMLGVSVLAIWADRVFLDSTNWADTSAQALQQPEVRTALSAYLVDQIYANVNVPAALSQVLPPRAQALAGPLAVTGQPYVERAIAAGLDRPRVVELWRNANLRAHTALLKILNGGSGPLSTANGVVAIDLRPLVSQISSTLTSRTNGARQPAGGRGSDRALEVGPAERRAEDRQGHARAGPPAPAAVARGVRARRVPLPRAPADAAGVCVRHAGGRPRAGRGAARARRLLHQLAHHPARRACRRPRHVVYGDRSARKRQRHAVLGRPPAPPRDVVCRAGTARDELAARAHAVPPRSGDGIRCVCARAARADHLGAR